MPYQAPAVVFVRPGVVEVREVSIPAPATDEVLVRTVFSGISQGTERWLLEGKYNHAGDDVGNNYPCFPGYQAAGVVEAVGDGVRGVEPGDHVMLQGTRFADPEQRNPGPGLASHVGLQVARAQDVTTVDAAVDLADASLYRMIGVARHGARLAAIGQGDTVVVIGLGMIGQMSAQAARRRGATVLGVDLVPRRVAAAAEHSADVAMDVSNRSLSEVVATTFPNGVDVVVDTSGVNAMVEKCVDLVRHEGRVLLQGYYPDPICIEFHPTHEKRATLVFPCGWDGPEVDREIASDLADGGVVVGPLITHRISYQDAPAAYELVRTAPQESLGMVFDWRTAH